jgi:acetylornithine/N-succinyldiaminopimelate aminotransferase
MDIKKLLDDSSRYLMHTYNRFPVVLRKGRGMKVWSSEGKEYLDFVGGIAVNCLGHCHPKVVIAIQKQAQRLLHVSNLYHIEPQIKLARLLVENSFADKVFFCNSGAEANEAAIKLARRYFGEQPGHRRFEIVTAVNSFHGRTLATLSATGQEKFREGFDPHMPGFRHVEFNNVDAIKAAITKDTCAVMLEPIQGEGGVRMPDAGYLREVRELCSSNGILLILDEVQTGMGRCGTMFAAERWGIEPDILLLGKGFAGGGQPIGAVLATEEVMGASDLHLGGTFAWTPAAAAGALASIDGILAGGGAVLANALAIEEVALAELGPLAKSVPQVGDVRAAGALIGVEFVQDHETMRPAPAFHREVHLKALERGLLGITQWGKWVYRMQPAINMPPELFRWSCEQVADAIEEVSKAPPREPGLLDRYADGERRRTG